MITFQKYVKAESLEEAYTLNQGPKNKILGGMLWLRMGHPTYNTVIDISGLGLGDIEEDDEQITIGAMATLRDIETHPGLNTYTNGAVKRAVEDIIGVQFRNLATVGGSIWGRFGFSDVLTVFLALDSYVELYKGGIVSLNEFSQMDYDNDILMHLIVKKKPCTCVYDAVRIQRTDFPVLTCAACMMENQVRVSIGARSGKARLYTTMLGTGAFSEGFTLPAISKYSEKLTELVPTSGNNRGSAEYRSRLVGVLSSRCLTAIYDRFRMIAEKVMKKED